MGNNLYAGKVMRINLSNRSVRIEPTAKYIEDSLGGRGLGSWILFKEVEPNVGSFDPENLIIFSAGPLLGTLAPTACRLSITTKNPLTGGLCSSNVGGHFGPELKFAGFDALIISGRADYPVYLLIEDGEIKIKEAKHLWGLTVGETEDEICSQNSDYKIRTACIGPAGENLVRGACIMVDRGRAAGRGGAGAVMGSKNLKAIATRGRFSIKPFDPQGFFYRAKQCREKILEAEIIKIYREGGSMRFGGAGGPDGNFPQAVKNYDDEYWPISKSRKIYEKTLKEKFEVRRLGCFNCSSISCSHFYKVSDGPFSPSAGEGFQINTARAFGSNLDIDDPNFVIAAHNFCSEMGLDVDMAGACLAWAFEAFSRGNLTFDEVNNLDLSWGKSHSAMELLKDMVSRKGFGDVLAEGVKRAAEIVGKGTIDYAIQVKGADLNEASMRPFKAWSLGIVLSTHGGGHLDGSPPIGAFKKHPEVAKDLFGEPMVNFRGRYENQVKAVIWFEKYKAVIDIMGLCYFASMWLDAKAISLKDLSDLFEAGTGEFYSEKDLMSMGERVHNVQKAFNTIHAGFTREDDFPPKKLMTKPAQTGPFKGDVLDKKQWNKMLDEYYKEKGWDRETGLQTEEGLKKIGLGEVANKLKKFNKIIN